MRTYGRIPVDPLRPDLGKQWVEVDTDALGFNDAVYITTLIQVLKLNINESPFYANYGIPAKDSVLQQIAPDLYVTQTQQRFAVYFAALIISKRATTTPTYDISVVTHQGFKLNFAIPVPT